MQDICANTKNSQCSHRGMVVECLSSSDGKEGIAKAANLLYSASCNNYTACTRGFDKINTVFTEADMSCALRAVGMFRGKKTSLQTCYTCSLH